MTRVLGVAGERPRARSHPTFTPYPPAPGGRCSIRTWCVYSGVILHQGLLHRHGAREQGGAGPKGGEGGWQQGLGGGADLRVGVRSRQHQGSGRVLVGGWSSLQHS